LRRDPRIVARQIACGAVPVSTHDAALRLRRLLAESGHVQPVVGEDAA